MDTLDPRWRKSSYSGGNGGNCVEVGAAPSTVLVRDTTERDGLTLPVTLGAWRTFLVAVKA
jgi:hypothetical protein